MIKTFKKDSGQAGCNMRKINSHQVQTILKRNHNVTDQM